VDSSKIKPKNQTESSRSVSNSLPPSDASSKSIDEKRLCSSSSDCNQRPSRQVSLIVEFKRRLAKGQSATAREFIEEFSLQQNSEVAVDLLYTEFVEAEKLGIANVEERLLGEYPQFAGELRKQIEFYQALKGLEDLSPHEAISDFGNTMALAQTQAETSEGENIDHLTITNLSLPGLQLIRPLGRGGMGIVYLAYQAELNRQVAVKLLLSGEFASRTQRARFRAEAQAAASLRHPNIVQVDDVGEYRGQPFLVMEYVEGGTLDQYSKINPLTPVDAARLVRTVALAVHEAHLNGIVHRDLKPGNILLAKPTRDLKSAPIEGPISAGDAKVSLVPKIADFGLAKLLDNHGSQPGGGRPGPALTMAGDLLGTPSYMAPEQASGVNVGPWTDIYSLGAILYQLLCGRPPFLEGNAWDTLQQVINDPHPPLPQSVPGDLRIICEKCLSKEPLERYRSMRELAGDLENFLSDKPISARPTPTLQKCLRWCRRNRTVTALGTAILVSLTALVVTLLWSRSHLVDMLEQTQQARSSEARSHTRALESLWDSTLAEALAIQTSGQVGQKHKSLKTIAEAKELFDRVEPTRARMAKLRDTAIAALPLVDVLHSKKWLGERWSYMAFSADEEFNRFAQLLPTGSIVVTEDFGRKRVLELPAHDAREICLSPNGKLLAISGAKCRVVIIDDPDSTVPITDQAAGSWAFSPSNDKLIGYDQQGLLIFDLKDHTKRRIKNAKITSAPLAISPDGQRLAIASQSSLQIFDLQTCKLKSELKTPDSSLVGPSIAWHPNGRYLAAAKYSGNRLLLWDVETGMEIRQYAVDSSFFSLSFDSTGEYLFCCPLWGGERTIFDVERQSAVLTLSNRSGEMFRVSPSTHETMILAADSIETKSIERFESPRVLQTLQTTFGPVSYHAVRISPDNRWAVVGSERGMEVFDVLSGQSVATMPIGRLGFDQIDFDQQGRLWANREYGWLRWEFSEFSIGTPEFAACEDGWRSIAISPNGVWGLNSTDWQVKLQNFQDPSKSFVLGDQKEVRNACFSGDSRLVATGCWNSVEGVKIWDLGNNQLIRTLDVGSECSCRFSSDGKWLFTSPRGGEIWNTRDWSIHLSLESPDKSGTGFAFEFSPDSQWCIHSNGPGRLKIVDLNTRESLAVLTDPQKDSYSMLSISDDQQFLFGTTRGRISSIKRWNLSELQRQVLQLDLDMVQLHRSKGSVNPSSVNPSSVNPSSVNPSSVNPSSVNPSSVNSSSVNSSSVNSGSANFQNHQGQPMPRLVMAMNAAYEELVADAARVVAQDYFRQGEWRKGLIHLEQALQAVPDSASLCNNLAWTLITGPTEFRDPKKSVKLAQRAVAKVDDPSYWNTLGTALYRSGKFVQAIEALNTSLKGTSNSLAAYDHYVLAACYLELGEIKSASEHFSKAEEEFIKFRTMGTPAELQELEAFRTEAEKLMAYSRTQRRPLIQALDGTLLELVRKLNWAWPSSR
jgi:serine/threonine protein kinase